ncbi:MAG TPA: CAP domain-containing protein [Bacillaceae bacterium]|nr:CAP domain-containing protein [Paenibacillus bovis]HLU21362.1 CAP domain-containing protein [Bacillaceae bacterium]
MKKVIVSAIAAVLIASPFAGKADASEQNEVKSEKIYYQVKVSENINWYQFLLKNVPIDWNQLLSFKQIRPLEKQKEVETKQPIEKPVEQPVEQPKPIQPVDNNTGKQNPTEETNTNLSVFEQQVIDLTNQERAKHGLNALQVDSELSKVAREKSKDMANNHYFSHNSPTYGSPFDMMKQFGITYRTAGENIAMGQRTPQEVVQAWMNSEGHRANILNKNFTHIGVGYVADGNYWTQQFIGK